MTRHLIIAVVALLLLLPGCGHGSTACAVVDVAKTNCDLWVRYLGPDGKERTVQVERSDLMLAVQRSEARRTGQPVPAASGGAP